MAETQPPAPDNTCAPGELGIDDVVRFLRSSWKTGVAVAILAGGITGGVLLALPRTWESSASLLVSTPSFRSELKTDALSLQAYQRLLESAAVVDAARLKLRAAGILQAGEPLEVGLGLESRVLTAKRSEETLLAPIIEVKARARSPEAAMAIVDTWIACFLAHTSTLVVGNTVSTTALIEGQYQEHSKRLTELEDKRLKTAADFKKRNADLQEEWNTRLATCRAETGALLTTHQNETGTLLAEARAGKRISERQAELDGLTKALADLKSQLAMAAVFKAMGQDQTHANEAAVAPSQTYARLRDQERQLTERLAISQSAFAQDSLAIDSLQRSRENAFATLADQRNALLSSLTARQRAALDTLRREESSMLDRLDQELTPLRDLVSKLTRDMGQAQIAKAQQTVLDVRVASAAVKPETPLPRGAANKVLVAVVLGGMAGMAIALLRIINRRIDGAGG